MHSLLKRQLRKFGLDEQELPEAFRKLLEDIDQVYVQNDDERKMLERSLELSSQELVEKNEQLQADLERQHQSEDMIKRLAFYDSLTRLPNRSLVMERLSQEINHAKRDGTMLAVFYLDLDRFKTINNSLGHLAGDFVLTKISERLQECLRGTDTVARQGGDEFIIVMPNIKNWYVTRQLAKKILQLVNEPLYYETQALHITCSIGISAYPRDGEDALKLLKNADSAMSVAKASGKDNYEFYKQSFGMVSKKRLSMESRIHLALKREEFLLYYQPRVCLKSGGINSVEALIRWRQPDGQIMSPGEFLPVAEESGLIVTIGEWVLRRACLQAREFQDVGLGHLHVGVNFSPQQFKMPGVVRLVTQILNDNGLDPSTLELEITEGTVIENPEKTRMKLETFAEMGIHISIDDFGTGYSSLNYLKRFPIEKLKIDRSFMKGLREDPEDEAIVDAIVVLARCLNMRVIAEGVETEKQLDYLKFIGCDEVQGYIYARPMPAEELIRFLADWDPCDVVPAGKNISL